MKMIEFPKKLLVDICNGVASESEFKIVEKIPICHHTYAVIFKMVDTFQFYRFVYTTDDDGNIHFDLDGVCIEVVPNIDQVVIYKNVPIQ